MRVLVVMPTGDLGGAELAVARLFPHLKRAGIQLTVLSAPGPLADTVRHGGADWIRYDRPGVYSKGGFRRSGRSARHLARAYASAITRFRTIVASGHFDVVHFNTIYTLPELIASPRGPRRIVHLHDIPPPSMKARVVDAIAAARCDVVVACSKGTRNAFGGRKWRYPVVIENGVPDGLPPWEPVTPPIIGTVGTISRRKGTDTFLDACRRVAAIRPDVRFEILGAEGVTDEDQRVIGMVEAARESLGERLSVKWVGRPHEVMARWSAMLLLSRQDPFPLAVLEAQGIGMPIVASQVGGVPDQLDAGRSGVLVPADDPARAADAVLRLLNDEEASQRLAAASRAAGLARSIEQQALTLAQEYGGS